MKEVDNYNDFYNGILAMSNENFPKFTEHLYNTNSFSINLK